MSLDEIHEVHEELTRRGIIEGYESFLQHENCLVYRIARNNQYLRSYVNYHIDTESGIIQFQYNDILKLEYVDCYNKTELMEQLAIPFERYRLTLKFYDLFRELSSNSNDSGIYQIYAYRFDIGRLDRDRPVFIALVDVDNYALSVTADFRDYVILPTAINEGNFTEAMKQIKNLREKEFSADINGNFDPTAATRYTLWTDSLYQKITQLFVGPLNCKHKRKYDQNSFHQVVIFENISLLLYFSLLGKQIFIVRCNRKLPNQHSILTTYLSQDSDPTETILTMISNCYSYVLAGMAMHDKKLRLLLAQQEYDGISQVALLYDDDGLLDTVLRIITLQTELLLNTER